MKMLRETGTKIPLPILESVLSDLKIPHHMVRSNQDLDVMYQQAVQYRKVWWTQQKSQLQEKWKTLREEWDQLSSCHTVDTTYGTSIVFTDKSHLRPVLKSELAYLKLRRDEIVQEYEQDLKEMKLAWQPYFDYQRCLMKFIEVKEQTLQIFERTFQEQLTKQRSSAVLTPHVVSLSPQISASPQVSAPISTSPNKDEIKIQFKQTSRMVRMDGKESVLDLKKRLLSLFSLSFHQDYSLVGLFIGGGPPMKDTLTLADYNLGMVSYMKLVLFNVCAESSMQEP
jgi:hypothetical protein